MNSWSPIPPAATVKRLWCLLITQVAWDHREGATGTYKAAALKERFGPLKGARLGVKEYPFSSRTGKDPPGIPSKASTRTKVMVGTRHRAWRTNQTGTTTRRVRC